MMPIGHDPFRIGFRIGQVRREPGGHGTGGAEGYAITVQGDHVYVADVEGIVGLGVRGYPTGLPQLGHGEEFVVRTRTRTCARAGIVVVVARCGPERGVPEDPLVHVAEHAELVFAFTPMPIGVVPEHDPGIGLMGAIGEIDV